MRGAMPLGDLSVRSGAGPNNSTISTSVRPPPVSGALALGGGLDPLCASEELPRTRPLLNNAVTNKIDDVSGGRANPELIWAVLIAGEPRIRGQSDGADERAECLRRKLILGVPHELDGITTRPGTLGPGFCPS